MSDQPETTPSTTPSPVASGDGAHNLLEQVNFFCGVSLDWMNEPYVSSRQVARIRQEVFNSVRARQYISTKDFHPGNDVDAWYTHLGWPTRSALPTRPWDILDQGTKAPPKTGNWVSRCMIVGRYTVSLRIEDLEPVPAFTKAVEDAFTQPTVAGQIRALRGVFEAWGEMIPLDAVVGASLAVTGTLAPNQKLAGSPATIGTSNRGSDVIQVIDQSLDITNKFETKFESRIQGGSLELFSKSGFNEWLTSTLNTDKYSTLEVAKVNRAAPITDLLPKALQKKIQGLFSPGSIISRSAPAGAPASFGFDGASQGIKDIKSIDVWYNTSTLLDISITYSDGTVSGPHDFGKGKQRSNSFVLAPGEFITEIFVWATDKDIVSIQFVKNTTHISTLYGDPGGTHEPHVLNDGGNALLGLSASFTNTGITQLQAVWRGDVMVNGCRRVAVMHTGGETHADQGNLFNDYVYLADPSTAYISQIRFRNNTNLDIQGLQLTYSSEAAGRVVNLETPKRGDSGYGPQETWALAKGEFITEVRYRYSDNGKGIALLQFFTNKGNSKEFGRKSSSYLYIVKPPSEDMVLYYLLGRSAGIVVRLSFVWGLPPQAVE